MSAQVKKLLSPLKPVCNVVKSNSHILTTILFSMIVITMIPFDLVSRSNIRNDIVGAIKKILVLHPIGRIFMFLLFVCLYVNGDLENMVLLLYLTMALNST